MSAANTDKLLKVGKPGTATTLSSPGHTSGGTSITVGSTTNWSTDTAVAFAIDRAELVAGEEVQIPGTYTEWIGVVSGATTITDMVLSGDSPNSDQTYASGSLTRVYIPVSATRENKLVEWGLTHADQDGTLKAGAVDVAGVLASNVVTYPKLESELQGGWNVTSALPAISTVVANGNRSYTLTHASSIASVVSAGMRRRFTRTSASTNTAFSLDGTNDYYSKSSPTGLSFTTTFTCSSWVYLTSYQVGGIINRRNADTEGWSFAINASGQVSLSGYRIAGNFKNITSHSAINLREWTHVAATIDMTAADTTVQKIWINGQEVTRTYSLTGTATALVQGTSALVIGALKSDGSNPLAGYLDQTAVFSTQLSDATVKAMANQALSGSETGLVSAYSNGSVTDLAATANNLTAQGGATTVASSWHGNRGVSTTLEYGLTMSVSSDGLTEVVQCPEGCALPAGSSTITASAYSSMANPYGLPTKMALMTSKTITRYNLSNPALSNASQNLAYTGAVIDVYAPTDMWVSVSVSIGIGSTSDFEFNPEIWVDGVVNQRFLAHAAPAFTSSRGTVRGLTASIYLTAGYHPVSIGVNISSGTALSWGITAAAVTVTIPMGVMA